METKLNGILEAFFESYIAERHPTANTLSNMRSVLSRFLEYEQKMGRTDIGEVTRDDVISYLNQLEIRTSSKKTHKIFISVFLNFLYQRGTISSIGPIPYKGPADIPRAPQKDLSKSEIASMMKKAHKLEGIGKVIFYLLMTRPMRIGELIKLQPSDIDFISNTITIKQSKNRETRILSIPEVIKSDIEGYCKVSGTILGISKRTAFRRILQIFERLGVDPKGRGSHTFRHTIIGRMIRSLKLDPAMVAEMAGNSTKTIYDHYMKGIDRDGQREAEKTLDQMIIK